MQDRNRQVDVLLAQTVTGPLDALAPRSDLILSPQEPPIKNNS